MAEIVKETKGIVERVKGFEGTTPSPRDRHHFPDRRQAIKETLRAYKSQDGELMVYKIVGGPPHGETEVKQLVETSRRSARGFISNKTRNRFSAVAQAGDRRGKRKRTRKTRRT